MSIFKNMWARVTSPGKYLASPRRPFWGRGNTTVDVDSAMQVAAFHRGLIYISTQIAKLPWNVKDADNKILENSVSVLLNLSPNPEINAFRWRLYMVQQAIMLGNAYAEIERDYAGRPLALWPLDARRMMQARTDEGKLIYVYSDPHNGEVYLSPRDVFHLPNFHLTENGNLGQGIVAYGRDVLGIQIAADNMAAGIFHNSGIPSGILSHPGVLNEESYKRLKESWDAQQGGRRTGATSILEEGVKYEPVNIDPNALQFLQSRQFGVLEIARFLGVPPTKLFDITASTYSNVEQSNLEVATDTLDTWATNLELEADVKLLSNRFGGRYTDIDLYAIFRGDMKSRSDYYKAMLSIAALTPNQIREREGMPGYGKDGDNYFIATNNYTPVSRMDEVIDADITQKTKPNSTPSTNTNRNTELEKAATKFLEGK